MTLTHRPYRGISDFVVMTSILAIGRKTTNRPYYIHMGDLSWWIFYDDHDDAYWHNHVCIWEHAGHTVGWSLIDPAWYSFDVYLLPEMRGTSEENYILDWTIQQLESAVQLAGGTQIRTVWVSEYDKDRIAELEKRGFAKDEKFMWYLEHTLNGQTPDFSPPKDFVIRPIRGAEEIHHRATAAAYDTFRSVKLFEDEARYERFMRSPVYNPNFDLVTEAPSGEIASFCIVWPDPINHIGLFEPVGTHQNYQQQGLGKAIVAAGLRKLKTWGMDRAMVCAENDNPTALNLYQSAGFEKKYKLNTYIKTVRAMHTVPGGDAPSQQ